MFLLWTQSWQFAFGVFPTLPGCPAGPVSPFLPGGPVNPGSPKGPGSPGLPGEPLKWSDKMKMLRKTQNCGSFNVFKCSNINYKPGRPWSPRDPGGPLLPGSPGDPGRPRSPFRITGGEASPGSPGGPVIKEKKNIRRCNFGFVRGKFMFLFLTAYLELRAHLAHQAHRIGQQGRTVLWVLQHKSLVHI